MYKNSVLGNKNYIYSAHIAIITVDLQSLLLSTNVYKMLPGQWSGAKKAEKQPLTYELQFLKDSGFKREFLVSVSQACINFLLLFGQLSAM